ncbi:phage tail tube protein [Rhizobium sp. G21]|uniref:phage tail tube protein n=1 Tax=Rhizobium sp. G21 TaxID=2758439 RepID=UPI0016001339|nr:phage tail tube protein [Rhizobium sp. G21]MBB1247457.1 hypothetical protein [Rhizobium sp. G21]
MTAVSAIKGEKLIVQVRATESGTEFSRICLINTDRSIEFSADVKEDSIPDCDHPEDPSWKTRTVDTLAADISGSGKWPSSQIEFFYDWFASGEAKQIRFQQNAGSAPAGQAFLRRLQADAAQHRRHDQGICDGRDHAAVGRRGAVEPGERMMRPGQITCGWAGADRVFRFGLNEIEEIEAAFDRSIFSISQRLRAREASLKKRSARCCASG